MNKNLKINDWAKLTIKNNAVICGQVIALGTKLVDGEEHDFYQVRVLNNHETTVFDAEIKAIEKMYTLEELEDMVIGIVKKHDIPLGDCPDHTSELAATIVAVIGYWDELSEDEKDVVSLYLSTPAYTKGFLQRTHNLYIQCLSLQAELQEITEKQAEKEKVGQDKGIAGLMEKYYPKSDNSLLFGYGTGEKTWHHTNH